MLRPVSDRLIAAAKPKPGERVIDVGCGCGATTIDFAERVGPSGAVLGLDVSAPMLARARERAPKICRSRSSSPTPRSTTSTRHDADLVVSRFGVMFFADPAKSFANLRQGLKPGGRLAFACWREAKQNPFLSCRCAKRASTPLPCPRQIPRLPGRSPSRARRGCGGS